MVALRGDGNQQQQQCMCKIGARLVVLTAAAALCLWVRQLEGHSRGLLRQVGQQHLKVRALSDPQLRPGAHKALAARSAPPPPHSRYQRKLSAFWPFRADTRARPSALTRHHHGWPHRSPGCHRGAVSPCVACVRASPPSCTHAIWRPKPLLFQPFRHPAGGTGWRRHCAVGPKCNGPSYDGGALST